MNNRLGTIIDLKKYPIQDLNAPITKEFFNLSSLILSKIRTLASTAIPMVRTIPAIPGRVKVAPIKDNSEIIINKLTIKAMFATIPKKP